MKKLTIIIAAIISISASTKAFAANPKNDPKASHIIGITIPDVAIIAVQGPSGEGTTISLSPVIDNLEAGEAVDFGTAINNSLWLNYTSIIGKGNGNGQGNAKIRKIKAELDQNLPNGLDLLLEISQANSGSGQIGTATQNKVSLKKGTSWVIDDIGSCYTETGEGKGHRLTYSLEMKEKQFDKLVAESFTVQVTYTITDN